MGLTAGRLRTGELIAGGGAVVLGAALFLLPWFGVSGAGGGLAQRPGAVSASFDGWHSLTDARWILLITIAVSVALVVSTTTRRSPAVPVALSMFTCLLGGLSSLLVLYRTVDHPGIASGGAAVVGKPGVYLGLVAAMALAYGGYLSLRTEGSPFVDPASIETVRVARIEAGSVARAGGRTEPDAAGVSGPEPSGRAGSADAADAYRGS